MLGEQSRGREFAGLADYPQLRRGSLNVASGQLAGGLVCWCGILRLVDEWPQRQVEFGKMVHYPSRYQADNLVNRPGVTKHRTPMKVGQLFQYALVGFDMRLIHRFGQTQITHHDFLGVEVLPNQIVEQGQRVADRFPAMAAFEAGECVEKTIVLSIDDPDSDSIVHWLDSAKR